MACFASPCCPRKEWATWEILTNCLREGHPSIHPSMYVCRMGESGEEDGWGQGG